MTRSYLPPPDVDAKSFQRCYIQLLRLLEYITTHCAIIETINTLFIHFKVPVTINHIIKKEHCTLVRNCLIMATKQTCFKLFVFIVLRGSG